MRRRQVYWACVSFIAVSALMILLLPTEQGSKTREPPRGPDGENAHQAPTLIASQSSGQIRTPADRHAPSNGEVAIGGPDTIRVLGTVLDVDGAGVAATVSVYGDLGQVPLGRVQADLTGAFDGWVQTPGHRVSGFLLVAASRDGTRTSFPLTAARSEHGVQGVLFLRDGCQVQASCDNAGRPCEFLLIERPTLPEDRQLRREDLADTVTVARRVPGSELGVLDTVCRACELEVRARVGDTAWGPPVTHPIRVASGNVDLGQIPLAATTTDLTIRVMDESGTPVPDALVLASQTVALRGLSTFVPSYEGAVPDSEGYVRIPRIGGHEFPLTIAAASGRHSPSSLTLSVAPSPGEVVELTLSTLPYQDVAVEVEGLGTRIAAPVIWNANPIEADPVDLGDPGFDPIKLLAIRFHKHCESQILASGIHRLHFKRPGIYAVQGAVSGGVTLSTQLRVEADSGRDVVVLEVPRGRSIQFAADPEARRQAAAMRTEEVTVSWRTPAGRTADRIFMSGSARTCWIPSSWEEPVVHAHPGIGWPETDIQLAALYRRVADREVIVIPGTASKWGSLALRTLRGGRPLPGCEVEVQSVGGSYMRRVPITVRTPASLSLPDGEYTCQLLVGGLPRGPAHSVHLRAGRLAECEISIGGR